MMNRVIIASLLLMTSASAGADSLHSSLGDPKTVEQKEREGVNVLNGREMQELKERALLGAEASRQTSARESSTAHIESPLQVWWFTKSLVRDKVDTTAATFHPDDLLLAADYWLIGIRTSFDGSYVAGVDDAGRVEYNYPWCTVAETPEGYVCHDLGPWNCSGGMTWTECCDYAKADVTSRGIASIDLYGNSLDCYDSPPPISSEDPVNYASVTLHVDRGNIVVQAPKNG